ncbi:MAG: sensor histidine kinase [Clostridia bacterium]
MIKLKEKLKSVRFRLFLILCIVIMLLVICLVTINSLVLENFYIYSKTNTIKEIYNKINNYYKDPDLQINLESELKKIAFRNNFDILIQSDTDLILFSTNKDFLASIESVKDKYKTKIEERKNLLYSDENLIIRKIDDANNNLNYILLSGKLENDYNLYIRIPIAPIEESVRISNNTLIIIGILTLIISAFVASFISRKFTEPILQLNDITKKMANLNFEQKYRISDSEDEINELGKSINTMSDKLESTIKQLRKTNSELEKDIEEKSKIDEMRKQFISDVSHELKTPIALIQGYAEGLIENVNTDDESRKFYAEVILDESNKMDLLVKQLLQLTKIEYGKLEFNNKKFDLGELIREVIRKCNVILEENKIEVIFNSKDPIYVYADDFYIEQIVTNYFTNAIKNAKEVNGKKQIKFTIKEQEDKVRVTVFNTGDNIPEEELNRIWVRFYKVDNSRNRENSGSGIGLSIVKAIQNNYQNKYGVKNKENGVEFYFDVDKNMEL